MIISVHIPKTAGRSFRALLQSHFNNHLFDDYLDSPLNKSDEIRIKNIKSFNKSYSLYKNYIYKLKSVQCIHGHFLPYKYNYHLKRKDDIFITWLRDPLERLVSHYFYRKMMFEKTSGTPQQKIIYNYSSFEEFCFSEKMQNAYDKFLYNFPIENFDFIGIVEHFNDDFVYFSKHFLNTEIKSIPKKGTNSKKNKLEILNDNSFIKSVKDYHSKDYTIYNKALNLRANRLI